MELVERDAALQTLDDRLRSVAHGTGQIALIAGEAGIGKTSLLPSWAFHREPKRWPRRSAWESRRKTGKSQRQNRQVPAAK